MKRFYFLLIMTGILISCTENNNMPECTIFKQFGKNEPTQMPFNDIIEDISVIRLDTSDGAPVIGMIEDVCESENAYYIISSETVYEYAKDGSFVRRVSAPRAAVPASI